MPLWSVATAGFFNTIDPESERHRSDGTNSAGIFVIDKPLV